MSFILISLFNTRFHSHLVPFHFFSSKINLYIITCDLLFSFWISELNVDRKQMFLERKHFRFLITPPCRNVGIRGQSRKGTILLKYQYFRFRIKVGAQVEILNLLEKCTIEHKAFDATCSR